MDSYPCGAESCGDGWGSSTLGLASPDGSVVFVETTTFDNGTSQESTFSVTGAPACVIDCEGTPNGTAYVDDCGVCDTDSTNDNTSCTQDCNDEWAGTAAVDQCGVCVGGSTGKETMMNECGQCCTAATVELNLTYYAYEVGWYIAQNDDPTQYQASFGTYSSVGDYSEEVCLYPATYTFVAQDSYGDGWANFPSGENPGSFGLVDVIDNTIAYVATTLFEKENGSEMSVEFTIPGEVCGGTGEPGEPDWSVDIGDFMFQPAALTVTVGDVVEFCNNDTATHTATADDFSWDTGDLAPGDCAQITFDAVGTFAYACGYHATMMGTVDVVEAQ
jgi:plastocyanin